MVCLRSGRRYGRRTTLEAPRANDTREHRAAITGITGGSRPQVAPARARTRAPATQVPTGRPPRPTAVAVATGDRPAGGRCRRPASQGRLEPGSHELQQPFRCPAVADEVIRADQRVERLRLTGGGEDPFALLDPDDTVVGGVDHQQRAIELGHRAALVELVEFVEEPLRDRDLPPSYPHPDTVTGQVVGVGEQVAEVGRRGRRAEGDYGADGV